MAGTDAVSATVDRLIGQSVVKTGPAPATKPASRLGAAMVKASPMRNSNAPPPASPLPRPPPALRDASASPAVRAASDAAATQELRAAAVALHGIASSLASRMGGARGDDGDGCLSPAPTRATGLPSPRAGRRSRAASRPVDASSDSDAVASRRSRLAAARVAAALAGAEANDAAVLSALSPRPPAGTTPRAARDHVLLSQDAEPSLFASSPEPSRAPSPLRAAAASDSERAAAAVAVAATAAAAANARAAAAARQAQVAADATRGLQPLPFAGVVATPPRVRTSCAAPVETPGDAARAARRAAAVQAATTATSSAAAVAVSAASLSALAAAEVADVAARVVGAVSAAATDARDSAVSAVVTTAHAGKAAVHAGVASATATATTAAAITATTALAVATATRARVIAVAPTLARGAAVLAFSLAMHCTLELRHEPVRSAVVCALAGVGVPGAACAPVSAKPVFFW